MISSFSKGKRGLAILSIVLICVCFALGFVARDMGERFFGSEAEPNFLSDSTTLPNSRLTEVAYLQPSTNSAGGTLVVDLRSSVTKENSDITSILREEVRHYETAQIYSGMKIILPDFDNVRCATVVFPKCMENFEILNPRIGNNKCCINHIPTTLFEIPSPTNVSIGDLMIGGPIEFRSFKLDLPDNPDARSPENPRGGPLKLPPPSRALVQIDAGGKEGSGGEITCDADFYTTPSLGFQISGLEDRERKYDLINIDGEFIDSGVASDVIVDHLDIDIKHTDPDGYSWGYGSHGGRGFTYGRAQATAEIDVVAEWGDQAAFGILMGNDVEGYINIDASGLGYTESGTSLIELFRGHLRTITKVDTFGLNRNPNGFQVTVNATDLHPEFGFMASEATPGPVNNISWKVDATARSQGEEEQLAGRLTLFLANNSDSDSGTRPNGLENFGNDLLADSRLDTLTVGLASNIGGPSELFDQVVVNNLTLNRQQEGPSIGSRVYGTNIRSRVNLHHGTKSKFYNCSLPEDFFLIHFVGNNSDTDPSLAEIGVYNFADCVFDNSQFRPFLTTGYEEVSLDRIRLGFEGDIFGLDLTDMPVEALPYLRIDAIMEPAADPDAIVLNRFDSDSGEFESINRPVDWQLSKAPLTFYSASGIHDRSDDFFGLIHLFEEPCEEPCDPELSVKPGPNRETCLGKLIFRRAWTGSSDYGTSSWDVGVNNGVIEAGITFLDGGCTKAGLVGRAYRDYSGVYAYLDRDNNKVCLTKGSLRSEPISSANITLDDNVEYILTLKCFEDKAYVYVNGDCLIDEVTVPEYSVHGQWGVKQMGSSAQSYENGPAYRYIEIGPVPGDTSVEVERWNLGQ